MNFIDMHCDTLAKLLQHIDTKSDNGNLKNNQGHVDLERLKKAGYMLQNFAFFVFGNVKDPYAEVNRLADLFDREMDANRDVILPVKTFADIEKNHKAGKMSALMTVEEGAVCQGDIKKLRALYDRGVRMLTLTWNFPNELGYPNIRMPRELQPDFVPDFQTPDIKNGLTEKGIEFIEEMEQLGMIVDTSHLSDAGFYDVLKYTKKPFVASHSNARAVCNCVRNLTDDMICRLADRGGVTGLNFCADFLTEASKRKNPGTMEAIVTHAKHIINIGGEDCLGFGTDFDGIATNEGIPDVSYMPRLEELLSSSGFTAGQTDKICFANVLRVYKDTLR